ncbi:107-domain-containing protein [Coniochaeta sp. 2T2.1]|nr:107-domain-containing protein [Coniochaeta sp. 2T2.1]
MARPFAINRTTSVNLFGPSSNGAPTPAPEDDRFADAEEIFGETEIQKINMGPQFAEFANALDKYTTVGGSPEEKRSQIFKLVDHFYSYSQQRADASRGVRPGAKRSHDQVLLSVEGPDAAEEPNDVEMDEGDDEKSVAGPPESNEEDRHRWEGEAQTWDLLRRVLPLRYRDKASISHNVMSTDNPLRTRRQYWEEFILSDSLARERKIVLEWLQTSANEGPSIDDIVGDLQKKADRGDLLAHGWLHTRHKIKLQKSVNAYQGVLDPADPSLKESHLSSNTLITQLDPDAMTRQDRKLEPQDASFERAIWLGCFEMLKRGYTMSEVRDWCADRTESWRAASMSPLAFSNPDDEDVDDFNPVFAVLWRRMCYATARDGGLDDYERAVYGVLAGDVPSVEKIISTWDEHLFAHYNALLRTQFDNFLVKQYGGKMQPVAVQFPVYNAVQAHGDPVGLARRLIASLEGNSRTEAEAFSPVKALQGAIVANDLDRFLYNQGALLAKHANKEGRSKLIPDDGSQLPDSAGANRGKYVAIDDYDGVRVAAHIFIVISSLDRLLGAEDDSYSGPLGNARYSHQESILSSYIITLRLGHKLDAVPLYCSKLRGDRIYQNLARNLVGVTDDEQRQHQLILIEKLGLDVKRFALTGVREYLRDATEGLKGCEAKGRFKITLPGPPSLKYGRHLQPDFFGEDPDLVDAEDENIIRYLEWMMLVPDLLTEAIDYATKTYIYFLKKMRLRAARQLYIRVPLRRIFHEKTTIALTTDEVDDESIDPFEWLDEFQTSPFVDELVEELSVPRDRFLHAVKTLWELEYMVRALDRIETLACLAHLMRTENATGKDLILQVSKVAKSLKCFMKPVLREWLATGLVTADFGPLREAYVPEAILAYISALHFAGTTATRDNLMECMELAAYVAEKTNDLTDLFVKAKRMRELLDGFASASKALAISTGEKKTSVQNTKKNREMGWSRELWSVRP